MNRIIIFIFIFKKIQFICTSGCVGSPFLRVGFSLAAASRATLEPQCWGRLLQWPLIAGRGWALGLLLRGVGGLQAPGFDSCGARAQQLWHMDLVALWPVWSSWTRDRTRVPCTASSVLNHWTPREAPGSLFLNREICIICSDTVRMFCMRYYLHLQR